MLLAGALMLGFLAAPLLALVGALPATRPAELAQPETVASLGTSLFAATAATLLDALLGIPLALWLARSGSRWRHVVTALVLLPLGIPPVVGGLILLIWLGPQGWLHDLSPINTLAGTIVAQMFVAAPFVVIAARAAFLAVDPELEDAARSLGCSPAQAIWRAVLPAARRGVAAGLALGWVRCLGEFGATAVVAYHPYTLPTLTYVRLTGEGIPTALPAGALLALLGAGAAAGLIWLDATRSGRRQAPAVGDEIEPAAPLRWLQSTAALEPQGLSARVRLSLEGFGLDVDIGAPSGVTAIFGPSGAGKSLTLRSIAGLVRPQSGRIALDGRVLLDTVAGIDLAPHRRRLGYVSQREALFEHLDVESNVVFGIKELPDAERGRRTRELLVGLGLERLRHAVPATLSGGERQRTMLARALAPGPAALLLDEPFSALDAALRRRLRLLLRRLFDRTRLPIVLVTHDREDVLDLAGYVVILEGGRVVQSGPVDTVFRQPARRSVAELLGIPNVLGVRTLDPAHDGSVRVPTEWGDLVVPAPAVDGGRWELAVPPDAVAIDPRGRGARIADARPATFGWRVWVETSAAGSLEAVVPRSVFAQPPMPGSGCGVAIDASRCHLMPAP